MASSCRAFNETKWIDDCDMKKERHPDCPLIEVPKHGRLIDADALKIEDWWLVDIKDLIRKRGMRQAEVARAIGIRPQYLHAIIVGERPLSIRYVVPLCKCLGITPNVLFGYERMFVPTDSDHASVKDWLASDPTIIESEE